MREYHQWLLVENSRILPTLFPPDIRKVRIGVKVEKHGRASLHFGMEKGRRGGLTTWLRQDFKYFYIEEPL